MKQKKIFIILLLLTSIATFSQGIIKGKVIDEKTRKTLPFVNILIVGTEKGATTDGKGEFRIEKSPLGYLKIQASYIGYNTIISEDYYVTKEKVPFVNFELTQNNEQLEEVIIKKKLFKKSVESSLSLQTLSVVEIEKNPGGNRDILKVLQSLPGVASNPGFRNDIIIRGGATSENKFYIDGIEVSVINHFQTQGATGGPVGIINADLIRKVDFYSSAFPANRGNALSSIIQFTQKKGNPTQLNTRVTLGTSDAGITIDGPLGKNTTFILSARQSYLQFLFKLIKLPFLPTYNDFQFNLKHKLSNKSELSVIGLGSIDNFKLNESVNDNITNKETIKRNRYILSNIPIQKQWSYTIGTRYKYYKDNYTQQYIISRNVWNNNSIKYFNNTGNLSDLLLNYTSKEIENKFRFENLITTKNNLKINAGFGLEQATYTNTTFKKLGNLQGTALRNFSSKIDFFKYAVFGKISNNYSNSKLGFSFGFRLDGVNYNAEMKNLFNQFSPRLSVTYSLSESWSLNSSAGIYYQLPSYTTLGYRTNTNELINQKRLKYIQSNHLVFGTEFKPNLSTKITFEGFYKQYKNYPFSVRNQISLANLGADFGVVGNEEVTSTSKGRTYGFEIFTQKKSYTGLYGMLSYTFVRSEFQDKSDNYIPSSWDNQHLLTITADKKLSKNWEIGGKFRLVGGKPYTSYNLKASSIIANYNISNKGILDYNKLNLERFKTYTQLDVRIDKTWFWKHFSLNVYIDVQNVLASKTNTQPYLLPTLDATGNKITNPTKTKYILEEIKSSSGNILPRFGFIVDF